MSRDYKNTSSRAKPASKGSSFFPGLLIGLLLGVGISVALAIFITGGKSPFENKVTPGAVIDAEQLPITTPPAVEEKAVAEDEEKPRFDFYTILPGTETQVQEQIIPPSDTTAPTPTPAPAAPAAAATEAYFLQVGAFQTEQEADNMKAKLALQGVESIVQTVEVADKGIMHRVRVGPFTDVGEINAVRAQLTQNGFPADLVKVSSNADH